MGENAEIGVGGSGKWNKTIEQSLYASNSNKETDYLTFHTKKALLNWSKRLPILLVEASYQTSDNSSRWHLVAYSAKKWLWNSIQNSIQNLGQ